MSMFLEPDNSMDITIKTTDLAPQGARLVIDENERPITTQARLIKFANSHIEKNRHENFQKRMKRAQQEKDEREQQEKDEIEKQERRKLSEQAEAEELERNIKIIYRLNIKIENTGDEYYIDGKTTYEFINGDTKYTDKPPTINDVIESLKKYKDCLRLKITHYIPINQNRMKIDDEQRNYPMGSYNETVQKANSSNALFDTSLLGAFGKIEVPTTNNHVEDKYVNYTMSLELINNEWNLIAGEDFVSNKTGYVPNGLITADEPYPYIYEKDVNIVCFKGFNKGVNKGGSKKQTKRRNQKKRSQKRRKSMKK